MPAGALWLLHYADDIDHRIQARSDRQRFAQDRNVLTATITRRDGQVLLEVQLIDDTNITFDESLRRIYAQNSYPMFEFRERRDFQTEYMGQFPLPNSEPDRRPNVPPEVRERIISEYISTSSRRQALAAAMVAPLRTRMDYSSIARRTFMVEELPDGALPIYDKDPRVKFDPPTWVQAGTWVKDGDNYAIIVALESPQEFPVVEYQLWRDYGPTLKTVAKSFCDRWLPSEPPQEPRTRFQRILDDDD